MKYLREQLHLSQREFARLIGVSNSLICLYESAQRKLPLKALARINALDILLQQHKPPPTGDRSGYDKRQQEELVKLEASLKKHIKKVALKALQLQDQLVEMQQQEAHLLRKQQMVHWLAGHEPEDGYERSLLKKILSDTAKALPYCGTAPQRVLVYKIATLHARIRIAQSLLSVQDLAAAAPVLLSLQDFTLTTELLNQHQ